MSLKTAHFAYCCLLQLSSLTISVTNNTLTWPNLFTTAYVSQYSSAQLTSITTFTISMALHSTLRYYPRQQLVLFRLPIIRACCLCLAALVLLIQSLPSSQFFFFTVALWITISFVTATYYRSSPWSDLLIVSIFSLFNHRCCSLFFSLTCFDMLRVSGFSLFHLT